MTEAAANRDHCAPRLDVSGVPPRGGYVARRCPLRVQYEVFPPVGVEPGRPADVERLRAEARAAFRSEVLDEIRSLHPNSVTIDDRQSATMQVGQTLVAMGEGVPVVIGGRLPTDVAGRREGRPDLLVRGERRPDRAWAYHPVDVRNHRTLDMVDPEEPANGATVSTLGAPWLASASTAPDKTTRSQHGDRLQAAHHHRMLEQTPHGSADAVGAVIGTEGELVWHHLDVPVVQHRWDQLHRTTESTLARYDFEFSFRLDVLAAAAAGGPIVGPVAVGECSTCVWRSHCWSRIEAADSTSLLPGLGYRQWYNLARVGITTRAQVAGLDLRTALVRDALQGAGDLTALVALALTSEPETSVADLVGLVGLAAAGTPDPLVADPAALGGTVEPEPNDGGTALGTSATEPDAPGPKPELEPTGAVPEASAADTAEPDVGEQVAVLAAHGIKTAADVRALDAVVVSLADQPVRRLAEAVQGARAQATGRPQLRHGVVELVVPTADVEIDIDMESALDGTTYLWGAWVDGGYHASKSWETPTTEVEAEVFVNFWDWLTDQRQTAAAERRTVAVYCWFKGAESGALRRGARAAAAVLGREDTPAEVEELLASPDFVDLYEVFTSQLLTGGSAGLKTVATMAGFRWRDADPNGADSMAWHASAVDDPDPRQQEEARHRLLAYNEDDVRATAAVRRWLRTELGAGRVVPA